MSTAELPLGLPQRRYSDVDARKSDGAHYTPAVLADFVAAQVMQNHSVDASNHPLRLLDPAVGDGALVLALLDHLQGKTDRPLQATVFDTSGGALKAACARIRARFPAAEVSSRRESFLDYVLEAFPDTPGSLFPPDGTQQYDLIIANPPYVRTQVLGAAQSQALARRFGLTGRVDLYHAFILAMARALRPHGHAGIIVSNRFMTVKAGASVRSEILQQFDPIHVWDLGDTKLFEAAVLPAVLLLRKRGDLPRQPARFTSIYSSKDEGSAVCCAHPIAALSHQGLVHTSGERFRVNHGLLDHGQDASQVWRIRTDVSDLWLERVRKRTWKTFKDIGKIRVGVKTTADKVFIRSDWHTMPSDEQPELLRPLTTHHIGRRFRPSEAAQQKILYPHTVHNGRRAAVDLSHYPRTRAYLLRHQRTLSARAYVIEGGRQWFEIWVPQDPDLWRYPKLVFRDISERPTFWVDLAGSVVNGDCYWLSFPNEKDLHLLWLTLAVANSTFIETFYDRTFNNKLYSGRRRFMAQYVEHFPLPDAAYPLSQRIAALARQVFELRPSGAADVLEAEMDLLVWQAFGVSVEEVAR